MAQQKSKPHSMSSSALRLPKEIMKQMREHAERETRTVPGQITVALKEWLAMKEATTPQQGATRLAAVPQPARQSRPAAALPQDVAKSIVESEEGWESTSPRAGTKVTI